MARQTRKVYRKQRRFLPVPNSNSSDDSGMVIFEWCGESNKWQG